MRIERIWAMPSRWTFTIKPIGELLREELCGISCDPFAGMNSPASVTNDLSEPAQYQMDALEFLRSQDDASYDTTLYDPPYSITQARKYGHKKYSSMKYWKECKDELARITKPGGKAICFGWNSMGLGKGRGFQMERILMVAHGGSKNDTIVTVETRLSTQ